MQQGQRRQQQQQHRAQTHLQEDADSTNGFVIQSVAAEIATPPEKVVPRILTIYIRVCAAVGNTFEVATHRIQLIKIQSERVGEQRQVEDTNDEQ